MNRETFARLVPVSSVDAVARGDRGGSSGGELVRRKLRDWGAGCRGRSDPVYGARPLKRVIQQRIQNELANAMLEGRFPEGAVVKVDAAADGFVFWGLTSDPLSQEGRVCWRKS